MTDLTTTMELKETVNGKKIYGRSITKIKENYLSVNRSNNVNGTEKPTNGKSVNSLQKYY